MLVDNAAACRAPVRGFAQLRAELVFSGRNILEDKGAVGFGRCEEGALGALPGLASADFKSGPSILFRASSAKAGMSGSGTEAMRTMSCPACQLILSP